MAALAPACPINAKALNREARLECRLKKVIDGGKHCIDERIAELNSEWTSGRAAKVTTGLLIVGGLFLSLTLHLWWLVLPIVGGALLLQYAFSKTSLVSDLFHGMGFRTGMEVEEELIALRVLRGDFAMLPTVHSIEDREAVTRMEDEGGPAPLIDEELRHDPHTAVKDLIGALRA